MPRIECGSTRPELKVGPRAPNWRWVHVPRIGGGSTCPELKVSPHVPNWWVYVPRIEGGPTCPELEVAHVSRIGGGSTCPELMVGPRVVSQLSKGPYVPGSLVPWPESRINDAFCCRLLWQRNRPDRRCQGTIRGCKNEA